MGQKTGKEKGQKRGKGRGEGRTTPKKRGIQCGGTVARHGEKKTSPVENKTQERGPGRPGTSTST